MRVGFPNPLPRSSIPVNAGRFGAGIPVSNRNFWNQNATANGQGVAGATGTTLAYVTDPNNNGSWLTCHPIAYKCTNLRLLFSNAGHDPGAVTTHPGLEVPPWTGSVVGGQLTIRCGVEVFFSAGNFKEFQILFNGRDTVTLDIGGTILSDPLNVVIDPANRAYIRVVTWTAVSPGIAWPIFQELSAVAPADGYLTNVDRTAPGSSLAGFTANVTQGYGPLGIFGTVNPRNQVVLGHWCDSVLNGAKNTSKDNVIQSNSVCTNDFGPLDFAASPTFPVASAPTVPVVKWGRVNLTAQTEAEASSNTEAVYHSVRHMMMQCCTHIFVALGTNDVNNGTTAANIQTYLTTICNFARLMGAKVYLTTIIPRTTSSDVWATAGNQTVDPNNAVRIAVNTWIRGTALNTGICDGVIEAADILEVNNTNVLTRNGGFLLTNGTAGHYTADGVHPGYFGNQALAAAYPLSSLTV